MRILFVFLFISIGYNINAQYSRFSDSIVLSLNDLKAIDRVNELNDFAFSLIIKSDSNGFDLARRSYIIAKEIDFPIGEIDAIRCIGIDYDIRGDFDSANYYYDIYLSKSTELNDSIRIGKAYNNKGMLNWHQGNFTQAIDYFFNYLQISEQLDDSLGIANSSSNIGLIYMELKQHQKSLEYSKLSYKIRKHLNDSARIAASCNNIGISFKNLNQNDSALIYYEEGIKYALANQNERKLAELYTNLAKLYILDSVYDKGYEILLKNIELNQSHSSKAALYNNLSEVCYLLEKPDEALNYAILAYETNGEVKSYGHIQNAYRNIANAYYLKKEYDKAREYYYKWGLTKDSVFSENLVSSLADLETKYQTAKKEEEIARQELEISEQKIALIIRNRLIAGVVSALLIALFLSLFLFQRHKRKSQKEKDEAIIKEKDKGLNAVILAQELERKRIAEDLHDGIVQNLGGITLGWRKLIEKKEKPAKEEELLKNLESTTQEIRSISHQMMPRSISELGIVAAIDDMLQKGLKNSDIHYSYEVFGEINRFEEIIEINLYRITQELINNVIKHSKAKNVEIQLIKTDTNLQLIVEDDGIGISSTKSKGIGLLNIASRVEAINGNLLIEASPQKGTLIRINIVIE